MDYLLIDVYHNHSYDFVVDQAKHPLTPVFPPRRPRRKEIQWLTGVLKVLRLSRRGDRIAFVFDFQAVLAWWICRLFRLRRSFLCINLLLDQKPTFRNRLVSAMYRKALPAENFKATVTSVEYGEWLNARLGIDVPYTLLRDVFLPTPSVPAPAPASDVFCGGRNGRDWDFMLELTSALPDVSFTLVIPDALAGTYRKRKAENVRILGNLSETDFEANLAAASVVCLPVTKQAPCGLLVLFQAAARLKPVLTTDTVTTRAYCAEGRGILLPRDPDLWKSAIVSCLEHPGQSATMARNMLAFCKEACSPEKYVQTIDSLLSV